MNTQSDRIKAAKYLASITYHRSDRDIPYAERMASLLSFYKKQASYLHPNCIKWLRDIENGQELTNIDGKYHAIDAYTFEDDDERLFLRESGLVLLLSIDTNIIPPSPSTGSICLSVPSQMELGI